MGHISANFTLQEMTKSQTAVRRGIENTPAPEHVAALKLLCDGVLERVRDNFKRPVLVSSGYRSPALCKAIGSSAKSQHAKGQAADFELAGVDNIDLARWIRDTLDYDQLILEFYDKDDPQSGWVHCSTKASGNRKQSLVYNGKSYKEWNE
jgi:zinc D-Ala-D-Ala carboxypeptidase